MRTFKIGGVHPEENKFAKNVAYETFPLPKQAVVFLNQHLGAPAKALVTKGEHVKAGQLIGRGEAFISAHVHAPVSGTVAKVELIADISGYRKEAIVIDVENDEWADGIDTSDALISNIRLTQNEIVERIRACGIVGLGGACFPTHVKYMFPTDKKVDYLLINAAECEPYITTDNRMMLEKAEACLIGIEALLIASGAPQAIIGIEHNKPEAVTHLIHAAKNHPKIKIVPLRTKYPQGAEKQLIKSLVNRIVPNGKLPLDVGVIVNNIATAHAVYEAVQKNKPLVETYMTVTGKQLQSCKNYKVRIGTSIMEILNSVGIPENTGKIISGGPMMGKAIANLDAYAVKGMSSLLLMDESESVRGEIHNCLRCGKCVTACPMGLEPNMLQPLAERKRYEDCERYGIMNCIECGSCAYGCPSNRSLLDYIRVGKVQTGALIRSRQAQQ
ncbi:MAG: electron transport complex subunit RsxC [Bacteroidales bacterium]|jgi:electron transport complex protein RnfC|nr:electron transport complex subunit RsxC [Bacteroidales bacterium]